MEKALSLLEELSVSIDEQAAAATACTELAVALLGLLCTWIHECPMAVRTGSRSFTPHISNFSDANTNNCDDK